MKEDILSYLLKKRINFWELSSRINYMPDFFSVFKKMEKEGLVSAKNTYVFLTEKGKKKAASLKLSPKDLPYLCACDVKVDGKLLKEYKKYRKGKLFEKDEFDQLQITTEDVLKKIEVMRRLGDLKGKRILCIGDDDLVGIALALTKEPKQITVLDIDKEILDYENEVLKKLGYGKSAFSCNLLKGVPKEFKGKYDIFITEPPDTINGITLFFSRGIECLKKEGGLAYLGISKNDLTSEDILKIESNILKMNGLIIDMFSYFEGYNPSEIDFRWVVGLPKEVKSIAKKPWFYSDLLRIKVLKGATPMIKGEKGSAFRKKFIKTEIHLK